MKIKVVAIACGLILTASMMISVVGTIANVTDPSMAKYERMKGSSVYEAGFLFVCPFH